MNRLFGVGVFVIAMAALSGGCSGMVLTHTALTPAQQSLGSVSLVVNNVRPEDKGGTNDHLVGTLRNLYGMPIKKTTENSLTVALKEAFADALASAGYQVVEDAPRQVVVDVTEFFMDGYMGYKITAICDLKVMSEGAAVFQKFISKDHPFANMTSKDVPRAYLEVMDYYALEAQTIFKSPEFQEAVK